jgi:hypothetical protein
LLLTYKAVYTGYSVRQPPYVLDVLAQNASLWQGYHDKIVTLMNFQKGKKSGKKISVFAA